MQRNKRLLACRAGLVVCCVLPTLLTVAWVGYRSSSLYVRAQEAAWRLAIAERFGPDVQVGEIEIASADAVTLHDVRLLDPASREVLATAGELTLLRSRASLFAKSVRVQVQASGLPALAQLLDSRVLRGLESSPALVQLSPTSWTLVSTSGEQTIELVDGGLAPDEGQARLWLQLRLAGASTATPPAELLVTRSNEPSSGAATIHFDTQGQAWPCRLVQDAFPALAALGDNANFAGELSASLPDGEAVHGSGHLRDVDLDSLVSERFPHQLSGLAMFDVAQITISDRRLALLRGRIDAENGAISPSLIAAAQEHLGLSRAADNATLRASQLVPFTRLSAGFELSDRTLSLTGEVDGPVPGLLLANRAGPILEAPPGHRAAAVGLIRALLPASEHQVPATRQTELLVGLLPVPNLSRPDAVRAAQHTPTRLAPAVGNSPVRQPGLR